MKIIKRGQLAMLSIAFMIMIAGYINYKYDPAREENLGQTMKASSDEVFVYNTNTNGINVYDEQASSITDKNESIYKSKEDKSLATFKTARDNMFSELEETYSNMVKSVTTNNSEVKMYQDKLDEVVKQKHIINIVEGIIKAKGIENIVIVPTGEKYNVMIKLENKLTKSQASMIQGIITDEFNVSADKVNIIEK